jgi:hypothetical protein
LTFLARANELKSTADYSVGPVARPITADDAARTIETAERLSTRSRNCCRPVRPRRAARLRSLSF